MPPRKARGGDDSDEDVRGGGGVKAGGGGKAAGMSGKEAKAGRGKARKAGDEGSEEEVDAMPTGKTAPGAGKAGKAKAGRKGARGGGDSDDELATVTAKVKAAQLADSDDDAAPRGKAARGGKGKAGKPARGGDESEEEKPVRRGARRERGEDDDAAAAAADEGEEEDVPAWELAKRTAAATSKAAGAKAGKGKAGKGKKGRRGGDDDDDSDDGALPSMLAPLPGAKGGKVGGKLAALDDSDEDAAPAAVPAPAAKGGKGKAGKGKKAAAAAAANSDEEAAPAPAAAEEEEEEVEVPKPAPKKGGKKQRGKPGRFGEDDEDFLPGLKAAEEEAAAPAAAAAAPAAPVPAPAPASEAAADAEAEDAVLEFDATKKKKKKAKKPLFDVDAELQVAAAEEAAAAAAPAPAPEPAPAPVVEAVEPEFNAEAKKKKKKPAKPASSALAEIFAESLAAANAAAAGVVAAPAPAPAPVAAATPSHTTHHVSTHVDTPHEASEVQEFFGEASMGAMHDADAEEADVPPEVAKVLAKLARGEELSNKERRVHKAWEEEVSTRKPLSAGYGASGKPVDPSDKYGIAAFSVSVAASSTSADSAAAENTKDINIDNFNITAHKKELFKNASLRIAHGRRYGLVGPNGQGKTTILKHIAAGGERGGLRIPERISVLYVEQEVVADDTPAIQAVLRADEKRSGLLAEEATILAALDAADKAEEKRSAAGRLTDEQRGKMEDRLNAVYDELSAMRADASEASARKILSGLGFTTDMQERPTKHFSGGWRMRISLARALFMTPDLLLLDEPTNHLDLNAVVWLEDYLSKWKNTLLVVSHDQDFLSSVVTDIIHLEDKKLHYYRGDYDAFKEMHAQKIEKQQKDYEKQQKMLKSLKEKGTSGKDALEKAVSRAKREGGAKKDKRPGAGAGGGEDADKRDDDLIARPREYTVTFTFGTPPDLAPPILSVSNMGFRYNAHAPWLFKSVNCGIDQSSRIAIVGPNGVGKSTFLSLLIGDLEPTTGDVTRNRFLRVGKYSQHFVDILPMAQSPVEYLQSSFSELTYQLARNYLGRFGLEGHAHTIPIRELSGGQKARVVFASLSLQAPHIMVLDEPSNNLDAESIDALGDAIREFEGGVVLVSHDARLIRNANCALWVCDKQDVLPFDGELDDYKSSLLEAIHADEDELDKMMEKRRAEATAAHLAQARERALRLMAIREANKRTGGAAEGGAAS